MTLPVDDSAKKNVTLVGVKLKLSKQKSHSADDEEPSTEDAAAETGHVSKWETGNR